MATLVNETLTHLFNNLISENLSKNLTKLEGRFQREQTDLSSIVIRAEILKSKSFSSNYLETLKECEVLADNASKFQLNKEAHAIDRTSTSRLNTDQSTIKNYATTRDKSVRKIDDKAIDRNKSKKEMVRTKTSSNFNASSLKKEDTKQLTLTKSRGNFGNYNTHQVDDSSKTVPKTPKGDRTEHKAITTKALTKTTTSSNLHTPDLKNGKSMSRIPAAEEKSMKRQPTGKSLNKNGKPTEKPIELKGLKSSKSLKKVNDTSKNLKPIDKNALNNTNDAIDKNHPRREINISNLLITPETQRMISDELLTKDDESIMHDFQRLKGNTSIQQVKIDYAEILDDKWATFSKYFTRKDNIKILSLNKLFGKITISNWIGEFQKEITEIELKIRELAEKHANDIGKSQAPFNLTRGALKAIELLNDNMYYKLFTEEGPVPSDDIILTYRIFFQLLNKTEISEIKDKSEFWTKTCSFLVKENETKMGTVIQNLVKNIDFSNENIYKISKMIGTNVSKINPNYFSKLCGTTGLFIFFIKDALEYSGIIVDKKTSINRLFKNYNYTNDVLQAKFARINKIQESLFR